MERDKKVALFIYKAHYITNDMFIICTGKVHGM